MLISQVSSVSISKWYLANHGAKDELKGATLIGIMLQRFILYTLTSFGSNYSPTIPIYTYVQASNQTH
jgi:hypothetical protein